MTSAAFDEILRRLVAAGAEFVVIGGLALGARGVVRATKDIDIVVSPDVENLKVVAEVAVAAGGHVQRGEALLGTPFSIAAELAGGEQMAIDTELGRLDIVQGLDGVPSFDELRSRASDAEVLGVNVAICSVEDLRAMKRAAGRGQDLVDLENLNAATGEPESE
jgi:predicted nucleotidyltransferase